ncbi:MAG TPA: glycosyltransferase, partial [Patescibacteria group bacterium]
MKLLIVAGGGGHFAPALAVLEKLPKEVEVLVVGRKYAFEADKTISFEYKTSQDLGINFKAITTGRLQRKFTGQSLTSFIKIPVG